MNVRRRTDCVRPSAQQQGEQAEKKEEAAAVGEGGEDDGRGDGRVDAAPLEPERDEHADQGRADGLTALAGEEKAA